MNLFNTRAVGFDHPIEMLRACHEKVVRFCDLLEQLDSHLQQHGINPAAHTAAAQIHRYFDQAAPLHHQDEELDFFPLLLKYAPESQADIDRLNAEHAQLHETWAQLAVILTALDSQAWQSATARAFVAAYRRHMAIENPLFDLGERLLPQDELARIGRNMAARRQQAT